MSLVLARAFEFFLLLTCVWAAETAPAPAGSTPIPAPTLTLAPTPAPTPTPPAYIRRGDEVEVTYKAYTKRLTACYDGFKTALKTDAPDLYKKLTAPPAPVEYGYLIVPTLDTTMPPPPTTKPGERQRAVSASYSWSRTQGFIDAEIPKLSEWEEKLKIGPKLSATDRRVVYEKMMADYGTLESNQRIIDSHVSYNRFWQKAVHEDKRRFDHLTEMHDKVIEREALLDEFAKNKTTPELVEREKTLAKEIHSQNDHIQVPTYLKIKHAKPHVWIFQVTLYTDIPDRKFMKGFKEGIEKLWYVEDREDVFRTQVKVHYLSPAQLYKGAKPPKKGEHIDVEAHVRRFPLDGAVLTTGANSTYAIPGRHVTLGPYGASITTLAHEFGHLLGYIDGYFRGYRDRGEQGYEVLEIVPDLDDIMCTPGAGHIRRHHFDTIIELRGLNKEKPRDPHAADEKKMPADSVGV